MDHYLVSKHYMENTLLIPYASDQLSRRSVYILASTLRLWEIAAKIAKLRWSFEKPALATRAFFGRRRFVTATVDHPAR